MKFLIHGKTHYGWIRVTVTTSSTAPMSAEITAYGYETIANKSVGTGLASSNAADDRVQAGADNSGRPSLGMLAHGADALALWRREEALVH